MTESRNHEECIVDYNPHVETIQVVLDETLLRAAKRAAHHAKLDRSALIRDALREHFQRLELRVLEERDRQVYAKASQEWRKAPDWEMEAVWPQE